MAMVQQRIDANTVFLPFTRLAVMLRLLLVLRKKASFKLTLLLLLLFTQKGKSSSLVCSLAFFFVFLVLLCPWQRRFGCRLHSDGCRLNFDTSTRFSGRGSRTGKINFISCFLPSVRTLVPLWNGRTGLPSHRLRRLRFLAPRAFRRPCRR